MLKKLFLITAFILLISFKYSIAEEEQKHPPVPDLGKLFGAVMTNPNDPDSALVKLFRAKPNIFYIQAPRGLIGEEFSKNKMYAWSLLPLILFDVKFESTVYLYTRDVNFDYYIIIKK